MALEMAGLHPIISTLNSNQSDRGILCANNAEDETKNYSKFYDYITPHKLTLKNTSVNSNKIQQYRKLSIPPEDSLKNKLNMELLNIFVQIKTGMKYYLDSSFINIPLRRTINKVSSYAVQSQMGRIPRKPNKPNQDSYFIIENPMKIENGYLFGVMDGHGSFGKEASSLVKNRLPINLQTNDGMSFLSNPELRKHLIKSAYKQTNDELSAMCDSSYSGTTSVTVFAHGSLLLCANVGDSRAVIGSLPDTRNSNWCVHQITIDHKPEVHSEYERIVLSNGRVEALKGNLIMNLRSKWKISGSKSSLDEREEVPRISHEQIAWRYCGKGDWSNFGSGRF